VKVKEERRREPDETEIRWKEMSWLGLVEKEKEHVVREREWVRGGEGEEEMKTFCSCSNAPGILKAMLLIVKVSKFVMADVLPSPRE
jgi:hypothetical protein